MKFNQLILKSMSILLMLFISAGLNAQPHGKLLIQNFDINDIGSSSGAFWSVVKDNRGILYFGGEQAVFEFDGINWRRIEMPNKSVVRSLAVDDKGTVYVGGVSEFGYLSADISGNTYFVSLLEKVPLEHLNFPDIWSINTIGEEVYFHSANLLFVYKNRKITTIGLKDSYHRSFAVEGTLLLNQEGFGLSTLQNNEIFLLPEGDFFRDMVISSITDYENNKLLIGTRRNGLFIYDPKASAGKKVSAHKSEGSEFLKENQIYHGIELPGNRYAFSSLRNGVIIISKEGKILSNISKSTGLIDIAAYFLYLSNETELWISSGRGISQYNIHSPISYWDEETGLFGNPNCIIEYKNKIFAGTGSGLFEMDLKSNSKNPQVSLFNQIQKIDTEVWDFLFFNPAGEMGNKADNQLIAATGQGLYNVEKRTLEFKTDRVGQPSVFHSKINPSLIYLNAHPNFYVLQYHNNKFHIVWEKEISSYVISIVEDKDGNVWLGTRYYGLFKIGLKDLFDNPINRNNDPLPSTAFKNITIENYTHKDGLPSITKAKTHLFHDELIITSEGIYTFDKKNNRIEKAKIFGESINNWDKFMEAFKEDRFGNIWGVDNEVLDKQPDGQYQVVKLPYKLLTIKSASNNYYHDERGATWIVGEQTLKRYDNNTSLPIAKNEFSTLIRRVSIIGDSVLFGGTHTIHSDSGKYFSNEQPASKIPSIKFKSRSIIFEYSCPYFQDDIPLEYSYMLDGFDESWSEWSHSTTKEYNNLWEKTYTFRVKARNYSGENSKEAVYTFEITPPWQRTMLAYLLYILALFAIIFFGIKIYVYRLKQSNIQLEKLVKKRTSELERQKEEINLQANRLRTQNDKLTQQRNRMSEMSKEILRTNRDKLKFFTNISHELRTPLTLILGPAEELSDQSTVLTKDQRANKYDIITKNARRLLALVNQILDFRKLEISRPKLSATEGELVAFTRELSSCFKEIASKRNINLIFNSENKEIVTWFDSDKIGKIIFNLLSNAFKFTNEGGSITVCLRTSNDSLPDAPDSKTVVIEITDSGIGIDKAMLPKIFDRYYQGGKSISLEQAGSGIGLSMALSLAEIHHGKLDVSTELGKGSKFSLTIPFGESYLKENEKEAQTSQNIFQDINFKAKMEIVNQLNTSTIKKKTEVDEDSGKELILIVDDSDDIRSYIRNEIEKNYDYIEAENGEEGFDLATKYNPRVIISDIMMPKMNGYEFCSKVKSTIEISHIPVILLTSKSSDEDQRQGLLIGADAYISKPFNPKLLIATIENLIQSTNRLKERFSKNLTYKSADIVITPADEKFILKALKILDTNLSDSQFGVDQFAKEMAMSQSTLYRKLKSLSDESTNNFIKDFRLKKATEILANNDLHVNEVSLMVGFDDPAYFAKIFKHKYGSSPSEYAKKKKLEE